MYGLQESHNDNWKGKKGKQYNKKHAPSASAKKDSIDRNHAAGWELTGDVAHRDAILPQAPRRISRDTLDRRIADTARHLSTYPLPLRKISLGDKRGSCSGLVKACLRAVSHNIANPVVLDGLSEGLLPSNLLAHLVKRVQCDYADSGLPFAVWKRLVQTYEDLPLSFKTYSDLVFDDETHLRGLDVFDAPFSFTPPNSIITFLDLSNTSFSKADVWRIRPLVSNTLVGLRLDSLVLLDDDCITILARDAGQDADNGGTAGAFQKLEILSLVGCKRITDKSVPRLASFPALQLLDLRNTSCVEAREVLRKNTRPPFFPAFTPLQLELFKPACLARQSHRLSELSFAPFCKANPPNPSEPSTRTASQISARPRLLSAAVPPSVVITSLSRLDDSRTRDPRLPAAQNRYMASHATLGRVYTTKPIDRKALSERGQEEADGAPGAAFSRKGAEKLKANLDMARMDIGWRRRGNNKRQEDAKTARDNGNGSDEDAGSVDIDSDLDVSVTELQEDSVDSMLEAENETLELWYAALMKKAFSERLARTNPPTTPEKHPLMLLRFFKSSDEIGEKIPQQPKRAAEANDKTPLLVKKRKLVQTVDSLPLRAPLISSKRSVEKDVQAAIRLATPLTTSIGSSSTAPGSVLRRKAGPAGIMGRR